eukprot:6004391-Prymnesium_polylepis.1
MAAPAVEPGRRSPTSGRISREKAAEAAAALRLEKRAVGWRGRGTAARTRGRAAVCPGPQYG